MHSVGPCTGECLEMQINWEDALYVVQQPARSLSEAQLASPYTHRLAFNAPQHFSSCRNANTQSLAKQCMFGHMPRLPDCRHQTDREKGTRMVMAVMRKRR